MIHIRKAEPDDMDWIIDQLKLFSEFYTSKLPLFGDEAYVRENMLLMMDNHVVLIADKAGYGPVGVMAGLLVPHPFNPTIRCLSETFWWVAKDYRASRAGYLLFKEFVRVGQELADWILCTIETHSPVNPDALTSRGFKLKEQNFVMEVV